MGKQSIEYQKVMTEAVVVHLPAPETPQAGMNGDERLHGLLAELRRTQEIAPIFDNVCRKWNIYFKER